MTSNLLFFAAAAVEHAESGGAIAKIIHDLGINWAALIAQMVNFGVVAFLLYRFAIKPVLATADARRAKIADGLRFEEEMKTKLADAEKQHAATLRQAALEAQRVIDEARKSAKELLDREAAATTEKTQQMLAKAEEAIALERRKMIADARLEISRLVALTAQRVLNRELAPEERKRYAETAARELTSA
jgi:F-type H+-transporting ATPase subunit b